MSDKIKEVFLKYLNSDCSELRLLQEARNQYSAMQDLLIRAKHTIKNRINPVTEVKLLMEMDKFIKEGE